MACDLNFVKGEGLLKVTFTIHIHWKRDTSEIVLERDVVTTGR